MTPDLHMHSTSSDGLLTPLELIELSAASGVTVMAITDHDTLEGVDTLQGLETRIPVLVGIELSMRDMRGLHLLGYGMTEAAELRQVVQRLADQRLPRMRRMVERLTGMGYPLDYDEICASCDGAVGRPHLARAMVAHGYARDVNDAFDRFIGSHCPGYVPAERLSMAEALPLLRRNGFVPVLAHPAELEKDEMTTRVLIEAWQKQGLMGVEVYHPSWMSRGYAGLDAMVRRMGLLVTGGSDYHTDDGKHGQIGCTAPYWRRAEEDVQALLSAMEREAKRYAQEHN